MPASPAAPLPASVSDLGEHALIARLRARVPPAAPWVTVGIGDDAAVVEPGRNELEVLTTDILVEGVHFDRRWCRPADIGHKALAVNLSDLAAMGARPRGTLLSLALPPGFPVADFDGLLDGFLELAVRHGVALLGGNLSRSPGPLVVDVTATGTVRRRRVLTRAGGRPGDALYLSGTVGGAAAGLARLAAGTAAATADDETAAAVRRYARPEPRVRLGLLVGRNRAASACVDLSDGLADAVRQLASASGTGATLEADAIPLDADVRRVANARGADPLLAALGGGEDYELLFAVPPRRRKSFLAACRLASDVVVTPVGALTAGPELVLDRGGRAETLPEGFTHFERAG
jgi:thiamine-monophosphate kinase